MSKTSKTTFAAENSAKFSNLRLSGGAKRDRQGDDIDCWISFGNWFFMVTGNTLYSSNGSHATTRCISKCTLICWLGWNYECSDSSLSNRAKCQSDAKENCFCLIWYGGWPKNGELLESANEKAWILVSQRFNVIEYLNLHLQFYFVSPVTQRDTKTFYKKRIIVQDTEECLVTKSC